MRSLMARGMLYSMRMGPSASARPQHVRATARPRRSLGEGGHPHALALGDFAPRAGRRRYFWALTFLTLAIGCRSHISKSSAATPSSRPNVLLVTIDTLRADHVGSYGYNEAS